MATRRRSSSCMPSCFRGSTVSDGGDDEDATDCEQVAPCRRPSRRKVLRLFSWSRFRAKKKTVPLEAKVESHVESPRRRDMKKIPKDNFTNSSPKFHHHHHHHHHQAPEADATVTPRKQCIFPISSKYATNCQPAPLHQLPEPAQTGTSTSHPSSPKSTTQFTTPRSFTHKKCEPITGKLDPDAGLLVLAMTLTALLLFGRIFAIVCVSAWFYLIPHLRPAARILPAGSKKKRLKGVDTEEYRKRVVLQGLLERSGRRPSGLR